MGIYHFNITLAGSGKDKDEAWRDATEAFSMDSGETPDDSQTELVEEDE